MKRKENLYEEIVKIVRSKGKKLRVKIKIKKGKIEIKVVKTREKSKKKLSFLKSEFTFWQIKDFIFILDEENPWPQGKIVAILNKEGKIVYISPFGRIKEINIEDSLKERLLQIKKNL